MFDFVWVLGIGIGVVIVVLIATVMEQSNRDSSFDRKIDTAMRMRRSTLAEKLMLQKARQQERGRTGMQLGMFLTALLVAALAVYLISSEIDGIDMASGGGGSDRLRGISGPAAWMGLALVGVSAGFLMISRSLASMQKFLETAHAENTEAGKRSYALAERVGYCGIALAAATLLATLAGLFSDWFKHGETRDYVILHPVPFYGDFSAPEGAQGSGAVTVEGDLVVVASDGRDTPVLSIVFFGNGNNTVENEQVIQDSLDRMVASLGGCAVGDRKPEVTVYASASSAAYAGDVNDKKNVDLSNRRMKTVLKMLNAAPGHEKLSIRSAGAGVIEDVIVRRVIKDRSSSGIRNVDAELLNRMAYVRLTDAAGCAFSK